MESRDDLFAESISSDDEPVFYPDDQPSIEFENEPSDKTRTFSLNSADTVVTSEYGTSGSDFRRALRSEKIRIRGDQVRSVNRYVKPSSYKLDSEVVIDK